VTLREEHKLKGFENRVLRGIFGPRRDEVTGSWRKLHNEELHNLELRRLRWAGHVAQMWEKRNAYRFLAGNAEGKSPLGRPKMWMSGRY
jgi:hypothetical protein